MKYVTDEVQASNFLTNLIKKMKKVFLSFWLLLAMGMVTSVFNSCSKEDDPTDLINPTYDEGVIINGVKWATRNVAKMGTFANKPEDAGMFYQWNRKSAWSATGNLTGWNTENPSGEVWEKANDPSPAGWRVPTLNEIKSLLDPNKVSSEWATQNGINGRRFTDKETGNSIFLPAVGSRNYEMGQLNNAGFSGRYWCGTQSDSSSAYFIDFSSENAEWTGFYYRTNGFSIRSVAEE